jgi:hypothetical protein
VLFEGETRVIRPRPPGGDKADPGAGPVEF